jgi:hypothetical protein
MKFKFTKILIAAVASTYVMLPALAATGGVDEFGMEDHSATCTWDSNFQHISVADFDGDGWVTLKDITLLKAAIADYTKNGAKGYQAFYDIVNPVIAGSTNGQTENKLDSKDLAKANEDMFFSFLRPSTQLDRQVAAQYQFTKRYRNIQQAIIDGFVPFTQEYQNHGIHLLKMPQRQADGSYVGNVIDGKFDYARPEGLNYDRYGNLVGVFYVVGPDMVRLLNGDRQHYMDWLSGNWTKLMSETDANGVKLNQLEAVYDSMGMARVTPIGFANDGNGVMQDKWHFHESMCERNAFTVINNFNTVLKPKAVAGKLTFQEVLDAAKLMETRQCDLDRPCDAYLSKQPGPDGKLYKDGLSIPRFFMLHTWIYNQDNRCGTMWGSHEDVSYNDLNPTGTLTAAQVEAVRMSIPSERASFVLQPLASTFTGTTETNKNYRKACLNNTFIAKTDSYEKARAILRGENVVIDGVTTNYLNMGFTATDIIETLMCPPKLAGEPLDSRCTYNPNDQ